MYGFQFLPVPAYTHYFPVVLFLIIAIPVDVKWYPWTVWVHPMS